MSGPTTLSRTAPTTAGSSACGSRHPRVHPAGRLAIRVDRKLNSTDVIEVLSDLFILRVAPGHVRSDNGPEFIARAVRERIAAAGARTAFIEPGSPWENGYCESFNAKLRGELPNGELFYSLAEARVVIERSRQRTTPCARLEPRLRAARAGHRSGPAAPPSPMAAKPAMH